MPKMIKTWCSKFFNAPRDFFQIIEFVAALKWLIFKGRRVSLVSKTVIVSQVKMMKEHLDFCVLEIDLKKFTFTTVEARTEVLLIKQKKGASYNFPSHDLTCCGLLFRRFPSKSIYG